jgi:hypothetical protein
MDAWNAWRHRKVGGSISAAVLIEQGAAKAE